MRLVLILSVLPLLLGGTTSDCMFPFCNEVEEDLATTNVVFSIVLFRHGDRAPESQEVYACDPYKSEERYWPEGFGNLLKRGRQRLYTLGKFLRNRYSSLLPADYHFHDINITSSDMDRTICSAQCVLAGLYLPQRYDSDAGSDIVAPIIPIHTINQNNDMWLLFKKDCPTYAADLDQVRMEKYNETLTLGMSFVYTYLTKHTCQPIDSITDVNRVHTALLTDQEQGLQPPAWATTSEYPSQQIEYIGALSFYVRAFTKLQKRLAGGPLLTKIVYSLVQKKNKQVQPDYKMMLFSGHDTTVGILLQTLGYDKLVKPDFGSSILFELHCLDSQYFVKVLYKPSGFTNDLIPLQFSQCHLPSMCTLDEFTSINQPWRIESVEQWIKECTVKS